MTDDLAGLQPQGYRAELPTMGASPQDADSAAAQLGAVQHAGAAPPTTTGLGVTVHLRDDESTDAECDLADIVDAVSRGDRSGPIVDGAGVEVGMWTMDTDDADTDDADTDDADTDDADTDDADTDDADTDDADTDDADTDDADTDDADTDDADTDDADTDDADTDDADTDDADTEATGTRST